MNSNGRSNLHKLPDETVRYSDDAIADEFSLRHYELLYCAELGWIKYNGQRWCRASDEVIKQFVRDTCRNMAHRALEDATLREEQRNRIAKAITSAGTIAAVERLARGDERHFCEVDIWDRSLYLLNTPGGTVDLKTGELRPHDPEDRIMQMTNATPRGECPNWIAFLNNITNGNEDLVAYLKRLAGYCLVGDPKEECLDFFYGGGGNGKGTFLEGLIHALGSYSATASMDTFTESLTSRHPTELAKLVGKRLVVAQEVDQGKRWNESLIKTLTGKDKISARFMRKDFFEFYPQFTLIIAGNHKPSFRAVDDAIRRRLHLVPFTVKIEAAQRDATLKEKWKEESDGILKWALDGCLEWQQVGLQPPEVITKATAEYLEEEDTFGIWLSECCIQGKDFQESASRLYRSYQCWKEQRGEGRRSMKSFSKILKERNFKQKRTSAGSVYLGLNLNFIEIMKLDSQNNDFHPKREIRVEHADNDAS
ncbi:phage/plasmid primase, P4 family [Bdellovibrio sp. SKB1291214]|uniref:phage/plasmid primase, P4 family n=1 Tax=Bdellovibrio sp. SKB1291214 TaxID=1732569 RepID=UPI000B51984F|nr:phage/plasmid primase, P4 family [Bdellovibrio sp. SKB1291214]UYL10284.1 phage/plasmid primase, P4 family [Bdellovibrio sp. SKB1291214]